MTSKARMSVPPAVRVVLGPKEGDRVTSEIDKCRVIAKRADAMNDPFAALAERRAPPTVADVGGPHPKTCRIPPVQWETKHSYKLIEPKAPKKRCSFLYQEGNVRAYVSLCLFIV